VAVVAVAAIAAWPPSAMVRSVVERFNVAVVVAAIAFPRRLGATAMLADTLRLPLCWH